MAAAAAAAAARNHDRSGTLEQRNDLFFPPDTGLPHTGVKELENDS
jgi:hypothetical protein